MIGPLAFSGQQPAAQRVRSKFGNHDIHELMNQGSRTGEVDPPVVLGPPGELVRIFPRLPLDQDALHRADHPFTDRTGLRFELCLQPGQPFLFDLVLNFVGE